jgi:hypothetical protein
MTKSLKFALASLMVFGLFACDSDEKPSIDLGKIVTTVTPGGGTQPTQPTEPTVPAPPTTTTQPVPPTPTDPADTTAVLATSWAGVKYAFCSAQGAYGVLIDFQGTDLSVTKSGNVRLAVRPCDGSAPFKWGDVIPFTSATPAGGSLTFDFGSTLSPSDCIGCGDDTIAVSGDPGPAQNLYGVMGGNSGPCVLLENEATGGNVFGTGSGFDCK